MKNKNPLAQGQFGWSRHFENFILQMFAITVGSITISLFINYAPTWLIYLTLGSIAYFGGSYWLLIVIKIIMYRLLRKDRS